jgi:3-oxoacyl-[acyl-carrier-protein] synthase II
MSQRAVITGMGAVTPIGHSVPEFWDSAKAGANGIGRITAFDPSECGSQIAGEIGDFDPLKRLNPKEIKRADRYSRFALYAAQEAMEDSGLLENGSLDGIRAGVLIGSGIGGIKSLMDEKEKLIAHGPRRVSPFMVPMMIPDIAAGLVSIKYGLRGPNYSIVSACASGAHSIGDSSKIIERGAADVMIAGGAEAPIVQLSVAGFSNMRALSTRNDDPERASRPFDKERDGFIISEGAGILVLESEEHAKKRGARIYARIIGYGASADAFHMTAPCDDGEGAYLAMRRALEDAGLSPEEIDYVNAHGTSTPLNDKMETTAIKRLLGDHASRIPVNSTKSMIGHLLGAGGAVELIATVLSLRDGVIHPTRNYEIPDPECDLDYVPDGPREIPIRCAISNSFGFGGHNASLIVSPVTG